MSATDTHLSKLLKHFATKHTISYEVFPPKTVELEKKLCKNLKLLSEKHSPLFISVTYGAGGAKQHNTKALVARLQNEMPETPIMPHLTCIGQTTKELSAILSHYHKSGIRNILALRGDRPKDSTATAQKNEFHYAADLTTFIRSEHSDFSIGVAGFPEGHPDISNRYQELEYLKHKTLCGADFIITQLFFDNRDFFDYVERCSLHNVHIPILAGILPLKDKAQALRISELAGGARIPAPLWKHLAQNKDGCNWTVQQIKDLRAQQIHQHIYTMNDPIYIDKILSHIDPPPIS